MKGKNYDRVLLFIACLVAILWGVTVIVQVIFPDHPIPGSVNSVMIIVATGFFGGSVISNVRRKNGDGDGKNGE